MAEDNRTERSTPKKRRDTRDRGEVARSQELSASVNLLSVLAILGAGSWIATGVLVNYAGRCWFRLPANDMSVSEWLASLQQAGTTALWVLVPILGASWVAVALTNYLQVGFQMTTQVLAPKWERLDPIKGAQRIVSWRGTIELLKALIKVSVTGGLVWSVLKKRMPEIMALTGSPLLPQVHSAGGLLLELGGKIGLFFLGLGLLDLMWQRYDFEKKLRMSKQEVRDELRQTEGDALVKYKRRARHRRLATSRMAAEVARADVITTNPTHYAVALRYDARRMKAPRVVAKGKELWAKLIVRVGRKHGVPILANPPLTRALFAQVEVGREVPAALYRAVAEILAAIYRLRNRRGRKA